MRVDKVETIWTLVKTMTRARMCPQVCTVTGDSVSGPYTHYSHQGCMFITCNMSLNITGTRAEGTRVDHNINYLFLRPARLFDDEPRDVCRLGICHGVGPGRRL